jgi:hypothetical protein
METIENTPGAKAAGLDSRASHGGHRPPLQGTQKINTQPKLRNSNRRLFALKHSFNHRWS